MVGGQGATDEQAGGRRPASKPAYQQTSQPARRPMWQAPRRRRLPGSAGWRPLVWPCLGSALQLWSPAHPTHPPHCWRCSRQAGKGRRAGSRAAAAAAAAPRPLQPGGRRGGRVARCGSSSTVRARAAGGRGAGSEAAEAGCRAGGGGGGGAPPPPPRAQIPCPQNHPPTAHTHPPTHPPTHLTMLRPLVSRTGTDQLVPAHSGGQQGAMHTRVTGQQVEERPQICTVQGPWEPPRSSCSRAGCPAGPAGAAGRPSR